MIVPESERIAFGDNHIQAGPVCQRITFSALVPVTRIYNP